jgi:WD40 repeat protein
VNVRLAISHDGSLDVWDLATGKGWRNVARGPDDLDFTRPMVRLGNGALFATDQGLQLVSVGGNSRRTSVPATSDYVAAGEGTLWAATYGRWRQYNSAGRPVGPSYAPPADYSAGGMAATADSIVVSRVTRETETPSVFLWTPSTGRVMAVGSGCDGAVTGSRDAIAYVSCDQTSLSILNARTGRVHTLRTPPATVVDEGGLTLSPDGSRLAFRASPLNGDDSGGSLDVFDTRTGRTTVIARAAVPLSWSPDGTTLLVSTDVGENLFSSPLAYWTNGMNNPAPIRIALPGQSVNAVLLP